MAASLVLPLELEVKGTVEISALDFLEANELRPDVGLIGGDATTSVLEIGDENEVLGTKFLEFVEESEITDE